jgi:mono/diheme cytochrome c family protein
MVGQRLNVLLFLVAAGSVAVGLSVGRDVEQPNYESVVEGQMGQSPAYDSFAPNPNFADGMTLRTPPAGTVARGQEPLPYKATPEDALRAGLELHSPFSDKDENHVQRGAAVFTNFCQACHGPFGLGDGAVTQGGFPPPPSLLARRALRMPEGQMFHVLTYGQGRMPSVAPQLSRADRWSAILYVRQLQRFHAPSSEPVPLTLPQVAGLFQQNCSGCHGADGTGELMRKALPNIPDFTSLAWQVSQTEMALVNQIDYGSQPLMPAFRYKLTREQIQGLAVYIRSFPSRSKGGPAAPVTAHMSALGVYQTYCFACHETTGKGNVTMRKSMPELPDFTSAAWQESRTDQDLSHSILEGKGKFMLSMKDKLGPVNVQDMIKLVRAFKDGKQVIALAAPKPPGPPAPEKITGLPRDIKVLPSPTGELKGPLPAPSGELAARIRVGANLFQQFCIICHGPDGTGTLMRASMPPIPNFTDPAWQQSKENAELLVSIMEGKGTLMPANNQRITQDQARDLVAFIRAFGPNRVTEAPVTDTQFERSFRQLQQQWDELERELQKLKNQKGR